MSGQVSSERYSWSFAIKTMCLPLPGPSEPSKVRGAAIAVVAKAEVAMSRMDLRIIFRMMNGGIGLVKGKFISCGWA